MHDIKSQLRAYFDETAERMTEEDVRIRATTDWGVPVPSPRFRPRPLAAGAIGFGLAMMLLGVVLVANRVFGAGLSEVGGNGSAGVATPSEPGSLWLFIPVVFGVGLLATGIISARRRNGDMRERGGRTMQTIEKVEPVEAPFDDETLTLRKRNRWLGWLAGILAVALVGLGIWLMAELDSGGSETAATPEIEQLLDDYRTAWSNADGPAYLALLTDDYVIETARYGALTGPAQALDFEPGRNGVETISEYTMIGTGPWWVTMASHHRSTPPDGVPVDSVSVVKIVDQDGTLKIAYHKAFGPAFD